ADRQGRQPGGADADRRREESRGQPEGARAGRRGGARHPRALRGRPRHPAGGARRAGCAHARPLQRRERARGVPGRAGHVAPRHRPGPLTGTTLREEVVMKRPLGPAAVLAITAALGLGPAWAAETIVRVWREENKPQKVEIKVSDDGQLDQWNRRHRAHVEFSDSGLAFYIGSKEGKVKFEKPGTYEYTVRISGVKSHAHVGTIVVK